MRILTGLLFCVLTTTVVFAESSSVTATSLRDDALASDRGWEIVESLTTEVGARMAGTPADAKAVQWAKAMLNNSGFDKVWTGPVEFPVWSRHAESARIVSPFPQTLHITALGYSGATDGEIAGEVVEFSDLAALEAAKPSSLAGKIVFINQSMWKSINGSGYGKVVPIRYRGASLAQEKGAIAVVIRSVGTDSHRFPHTGATAKLEAPFPAAALSGPDADQLSRALERGRPVVMALNIDVSTQPGGKSWNVIAQINGRELPNEIVVIGGHLDSWDLGTGAIDDGAGVAITSAAAQLIAELPQAPRRSIRVVLFANEEQGIWGGKAYAAAHADELANHRFASESDFGAGAIWRFETADVKLQEAAMPILAPLNISAGGAASGGGPDMGPIMSQGVPVFRLLQDGTDYFDYHHTADDTLDKIDPQQLRQNIAAWAVVVFLAAELD